jgi:N-carbamoylputrescine amidase
MVFAPFWPYLCKMKSNLVKVGLVQQTCTANPNENLQKSLEGIQYCAAQGAKLIVLQELHKGLYFCQTENPDYFDAAETIPGPSTEFFGSWSERLGIVLVLSLFEKRAAGLYHNTAVVLDKGNLVGKYRKMHIPDDPAYYEKYYFTPGDLGFNPIETSVGKLGLLVCWDQWYPEAARLMALKGAEMLIYPTAIGWDPLDSPEEQNRQQQAWTTIQRSHAVANGLHTLVANRVGKETDPFARPEGQIFWGSSFVSGPQGEILAQAGSQFSENLIVEIDLSKTEQVRRIWPFLRDRRIDAYQDLTKRFLD